VSRLDPAGQGRLVVTPDGHHPSVWAPLVQAADCWDLADLRRTLEVAAGRPTLVALSAHPDDETLGLGRLASAWARLVGPVTGVLATAGEACFDGVMSRPAELASVRLAEWQAATDRLGFTDRHHVGVPDGALADSEPELAERLTAVVQVAAKSSSVVLAAPWRFDPHPDHRAAGRVATRVGAALEVAVLEYGVWMTYWGDPATVAGSSQRLVRVSLDAHADTAFASACRCFVSQLAPYSDEVTAVVPPAMLALHTAQLLIVPAHLVVNPSAHDRSEPQ